MTAGLTFRFRNKKGLRFTTGADDAVQESSGIAKRVHLYRSGQATPDRSFLWSFLGWENKIGQHQTGQKEYMYCAVGYNESRSLSRAPFLHDTDEKGNVTLSIPRINAARDTTARPAA